LTTGGRRPRSSGPGRPPQEAEATRDEHGLSSARGLTNGLQRDAPSGLEVDVGLINGLPTGRGRAGRAARPLAPGSKRKDRTARAALERKAAQPLPGTGGG
jgi:hypothetical protein